MSRFLLPLTAFAVVTGASAGPGLLVRHAEDYYKPPVRRRLHAHAALPARPPERMQLPFREEDLFALEEAGYFTALPRETWDSDAPCSRFRALHLLGGLLEELDRDHGAVLRPYLTGVRHRLVPPRRPGRARVRLALALGLAAPKPSQLVWWDEAPDRFQAAEWIDDLVERLEPVVTFLVDPAPYARTLRGDLPYYGHPMRRRVKRVLETRIFAAPGGRFRGRAPLTRRGWVRILSRLRFVVRGYTDAPTVAGD